MFEKEAIGYENVNKYEEIVNNVSCVEVKE